MKLLKESFRKCLGCKRQSCRLYSSSSLDLPRKRQTFLERVCKGPGLQEFINVKVKDPFNVCKETNVKEFIPYLSTENYDGQGRKVFFEVYGCQMNTNDTEVVWSILKNHGYTKCSTDLKEANIIIIVTCAIREGAETKIWNRLQHLKAMKDKWSTKRNPMQIVILGCMAERLKYRLLEKEKCVDVVAGPDSYKDLPRLLALSQHYRQSVINVLLSLDETYADITPIRLNTQSPTAFVSIMRGCDNMCSYCIVPFTRGRERSRPIESIKREVLNLRDQGIREITLLGQNVNSYRDTSKRDDKECQEENMASPVVEGFKTIYKLKQEGLPFYVLLREVAEVVPDIRIRFTSPHPKDFSENVLSVMRDYPNICNSIHLPAQSGNDAVLQRMRRGYTRSAYLNLVDNIRNYLPEVGLSSDFICGFCGETEAEFNDTLTLMEKVRYNVAYLFAYSMREKTAAHRKYTDDVPHHVKNERLQRMIKTFREGASKLHKECEGRQELILIEGISKRSSDYVFGRTDSNIKVIVPLKNIPIDSIEANVYRKIDLGDFVVAHITESNSQILKGNPLYITSIHNYYCSK